MASSLESKTSLDVLQIMLNDALVQTGKALRASRKEAPGSMSAANTSARYKIPETMRTFHSALDDLEQEIIRAKGVMQRDISRLRESKMEVEPPQLIEPQSKSPMVIDLDSSPPPAPKTEPEDEAVSLTKKTIAPFPDMGLDISGTSAPGPEGLSSQALIPSVEVEPKIEPSPAAPVPAMSQADLEQQPKAPITDSGVSGAPNAELHFTNMEFALAQPENGQQNDASTGEHFDLTSFAAPDGANGSLSLEGLAPQPTTNNSGGSDLLAVQGDTSGIPDQMNGDNNVTDEALDNLLDMDFSGADGTDFDFSMDGGNSFNELMTNHDGTFDTTMSQGGFDEDLFNFDKPEGA
ncbi:unnamed protein product [Clonostachys rhizophaga]|uniref:Uncharacterized protein n=1 Tax=Clonostachys rhizophaga TaxID=160324 RepID=A0A9N9VB16_9HYPO|nr:unnamed protein product [Clonostachys rhizophaga]